MVNTCGHVMLIELSFFSLQTQLCHRNLHTLHVIKSSVQTLEINTCLLPSSCCCFHPHQNVCVHMRLLNF